MTLVENIDSSYQSIYLEIMSFYINNLGKEKWSKVYKKIYNSNKINDLIRVSHQKMILPNEHDFLNSLKEVPYFIFSNSDIHTLGALLALNRWNEECNKHIHLADEPMLLEIMGGILHGYDKL